MTRIAKILRTVMLLAFALFASCDSLPVEPGEAAVEIEIPAGQGMLTIVNASSRPLQDVFFSFCEKDSLDNHTRRPIPVGESRSWFADEGCYSLQVGWSDDDTSEQIDININEGQETALAVRD